MRIPLRPEPVGADIAASQQPCDWSLHFGSATGPLELEIGCGAGGFAIDYCARYPNARFVAFEWRKKFAREVQHRAEKRGVKNLRVVEGDARAIVPRIFAPKSLRAIHLQFPDPWWKRAHHKRAILQPDFTAFLRTLLEPNGLFDFRTDVEDRGQQGLRILEQAGFVNPLGAGTFHPYDAEEVPSTRERRYLVTGQPVYRARLINPT